MADVEDVFDMLDGESKPFESNEKKDDKKFDYYGNPDVKPIKPDPSKFKKPGKTFMVAINNYNTTIPKDTVDEIVKIAKALFSKGWKFRHNGSEDDLIQNAILEIEDANVESYIPWKKFNTKIKNPYLTKATPDAYHIASAGFGKFFKERSNGLRSIFAMAVNTMLGEDCKSPVGLVIAWNEDGAEVLDNKPNYKTLGNLAFYLRICEWSNIPVFNVKNEDAVSRIVKTLKSKEEESKGLLDG